VVLGIYEHYINLEQLELVGEIERYTMKCVALQEVRLEEAGTTKISQTTIINGRSERGHKLGTGFAVYE